MHDIISLSITNNLHWNIEYSTIFSLSDRCSCIKIIIRNLFMCVGVFRKELH